MLKHIYFHLIIISIYIYFLGNFEVVFLYTLWSYFQLSSYFVMHAATAVSHVPVKSKTADVFLYINCVVLDFYIKKYAQCRSRNIKASGLFYLNGDYILIILIYYSSSIYINTSPVQYKNRSCCHQWPMLT